MEGAPLPSPRNCRILSSDQIEMSTAAQTLITEEEYLEIERRASSRSEYRAGVIHAMSGASMAHVRIARNLVVTLVNQLHGGPFEVFSTDLRLRVNAARLYTYPDIMVVCGPPQTPPDTDDTILNPKLIIEILSDSTKNYDRGEKFQYYRSLQSLDIYLTVSQDVPQVECYCRTDAQSWLMTEYQGLHAVVSLESIGATIALADAYYGISFD